MPPTSTTHRIFPSVASYVTELGGGKKKVIQKILIANNGIGAVKCIRSVRKWAYDTFGNERSILFVVMATPEDLRANAEYIRMGDEIVDVPGGSNNNNYANVKLIVEIARFHRVDAVWAGWGHASENPLLPNSLHKQGIKFIGPAGPAMAALGDKIGSTIIAQTAGVPCISWNGDGVYASYDKETGSLPRDSYDRCNVKTQEEAVDKSKVIGFPVMIKASEGGGGKGIRMVREESNVATAYRQVTGEVPGSPIFIMKLSDKSRHLEVQLIADEYGDAIALNGRDCSVQRRHQKIIEEGPPVAADQEVWKEMEKAAVQLAKAVNYVNAGTVEYLYSEPDKKFYFLELNPRLQVEHPVTEMITTVNLPATQLQIAMGIPLSNIADIRKFYGKERFSSNVGEKPSKINFEAEEKNKALGHCIAVRITAENAEQGFKPTSGGIQELNFRSTPDVWGYFSMDSSGTVHEFADSQFGHLFASGVDREQARKNMVLALKELSIRGDISTTVDYISNLIQLEDFKENNIDTGWLDKLIAQGGLEPEAEAPAVGEAKHHLYVLLAASLTAFDMCLEGEMSFKQSLEKGQIPPQSLLTPFHPVELIYNSIKYKLNCIRSGESAFTVMVDGNNSDYISTNVRSLSDGGYLIKIDNKSHVVYKLSPRDAPGGLKISVSGTNVSFTPDYDPTTLTTDVAGKLVKQLVADGTHLDKGEPYAEIEVMKMFLPLKVEEAGTITWKSNEGAALTPGHLIGTLALDAPEMVKTATVFTGSLKTNNPDAPPVAPKARRAHVLLRDAVSSLRRVMSGFVIPSDNLTAALQDLQAAVSDPTLPVYEVDEQLSVLSGRMDANLFSKFTDLIEGFKVTHAKATDQPLPPFPAHTMITDLEKHTFSIKDPSERTAFITQTTPLREALTPYKSQTVPGNYGSERALQALLTLLREFIAVERNFCDNVEYADAVDTLRKQGGEPAFVMATIRAHSQLAETSKLASLLIEVIGGAAVAAKNATTTPAAGRRRSVVEGASSLFAAVPCLSEIGQMGGNPIYVGLASNARKLLLAENAPSVDQRSKALKDAIATVSKLQGHERIATIAGFVKQNISMRDLFFEELASTADKQALLEIYLNKTYRPYDVGSFACSPLGVITAKWTFRVKGSSSSAALNLKPNTSFSSMDDLTKLMAADSTIVDQGGDSDSDSSVGGIRSRVPAATERVGVFIEIRSLDDFEGVMGDVYKMFPQFMKEKPRRLDGPVNAIHVCLPSLEVDNSNQRNIASSCEQLLAKQLDSLSKADIRRVTFIMKQKSDMQSLPAIFNFRSRTEFKEDVLYRNIEPSLAYNLDLSRISKNFSIEPIDVIQSSSSSNVHLYIASPKAAKLAKDKGARKNPRVFIRAVAMTNDYSTSSYERVFVDALNALDATGAASLTDNHLFVNLLSDNNVVQDPSILERAITKVVERNQERLNLLGVVEIESKITCSLNSDQGPIALRIVVSNPTKFVNQVATYVEAVEKDESAVFRSVGGTTFEWEGLPTDFPYPLSRPFDRKRRLATKLTGTLYCYDIPTVFRVAVDMLWDNYVAVKSEGGFGGEVTKPQNCASFVELVVRRRRKSKVQTKSGVEVGSVWTMEEYLDGDLEMVESQRAAGGNDVAMVAWLVNIKTPEYPSGRQFILISNDITISAGSFGTREDVVFKMASEYARRRKLPRLYCAANSGARIGMAESVKSKFKVSFKDDAKPEGGFKYLYMDETSNAVITEPVDGKNKLVGIVGIEQDLGVENLKGSGLIAGETSVAYDEIFTLTIVLGRSVGIGAYLARLGQRCVQKRSLSPLILTGYQALNKLMNSNVYSTNDQLGGPQIMGPNGISHLLASTHLDAIFQSLEWLSFVPSVRNGELVASDIRGVDVVDRDITFSPAAGVPYDPRLLLQGGFVDDQWKSGLFDKASFRESMADWAKTVVAGRARLGGIPVGVIATENRTVEKIISADPADVKSSEIIVPQAGGVWFPDSSSKTATALRDFQGEDLPVFIIANWRGFSGGARDMCDEVLKFGSQIVDALVATKQPVFVYVPPFAEVRGGAWVVIDSTINSEVMEFYAASNARGGVLEAAAAAGIKYRQKDLLKTMHRLDGGLVEMDGRLEGRLEDKERASLQQAVKERENSLLPVYAQIAEQFADLHDTPGRMKAKGVIRDIVEWKDARRVFYGRLRRRLAEFRLRDRIVEVGSVGEEMKTSTASKLLKKWFVSGSGGDQNDWGKDAFVLRWINEESYTIEKKIAALKTDSVTRCIKNSASLSEEGLIEGIRAYMSSLSREKAETFGRDIMDALEL